jgi:hypothetical protein
MWTPGNIIGVGLCFVSAVFIVNFVNNFLKLISEGDEEYSRLSLVISGFIVTALLCAPSLAVFAFGLKLAGA